MVINDTIEKEIQKENAVRTMKTAISLTTGTKLSAGTFWEFKKQMDRRGKNETPSVMLDKKREE